MKNLVITGDSLSYNRYGYDDIPCINAYDCHIGMNSWSFRLRNAFLTNATGFKYGDELNFSESTILGIGNGVDDIDAVFGKRVVTVVPNNDMINFSAKSDTGQIIIYFQTRPDNYCRFNIFSDGKLVKKAVETYGGNRDFQGYDIKAVKFNCDKEKTEHKITFSDFEYTENEPFVTIAGISTKERNAYITGQGSRTAKFLLYHFNDRIANYFPDMLILIFGGNDFLFYSESEYEVYLEQIFKRMKKEFPACKITTLTIPPSGKTKEEVRGIKIASDEELNIFLDKYNNVLEKLSEKNGALCVKLKDIFKDISPDVWRYDNVHLSNKGNDILYNEVSKILFSQ